MIGMWEAIKAWSEANIDLPTVVLIVMLGFSVQIVRLAQRNGKVDFSEMIKDDTGKASALRLVVLGAFAISCWVIMHESLVAGQVSSELFLGWLGIWVTAALGGKGIEAWRSKP